MGVRFTTENKLWCSIIRLQELFFEHPPSQAGAAAARAHRAMVVAPQGQVREEIRLVNSLDYE